VPGLFGGSKKKSEEHLRKSLTYNPNSTASLFFLAETLIELDRNQEARETLQKILDAPLDPEWAPEDREFKQKAAEMLKEMKEVASCQLPVASYQFPVTDIQHSAPSIPRASVLIKPLP
jgi:tetratricopeptide (TPR) repeat protein